MGRVCLWLAYHFVETSLKLLLFSSYRFQSVERTVWWLQASSGVQGQGRTGNEVSCCCSCCAGHDPGIVWRLPPHGFTVSDVHQLVGARRQVDVMDTCTQEATVMSMQQWSSYFASRPRERLLNVISLEFSCTRLDPLVQPPTVVRAHCTAAAQHQVISVHV